MSSITDAINAYSALSKATSGGGMEVRDASEVPGTDFASMLKTAAQDTVSSLKTAEAGTAAAVAGKADIREVVAAVTNAELTLETVVNVRDKVINAYNDIMRMPI